MTDMTSVLPLPAARELTTIRPLRARKFLEQGALCFDIIAIVDPFSCRSTSRDTELQASDSWLHSYLPVAFEDARILAFGHVERPRLESNPVADSEAFHLSLLRELLQYRRKTNTVSITELRPIELHS